MFGSMFIYAAQTYATRLFVVCFVYPFPFPIHILRFPIDGSFCLFRSFLDDPFSDTTLIIT